MFQKSYLINSTLLNKIPNIKRNTHPAIVSPSPLYLLPNAHILLHARPEIHVYLPYPIIEAICRKMNAISFLRARCEHPPSLPFPNKQKETHSDI